MKQSNKQPRILVAGVGNDLKKDDGFGIAVIRALDNVQMSNANVSVQEVGIGGIHMVQELMTGYDVLMMVDAVDRGDPAGTLSIREIEEVTDLNTLPDDKKSAFLADIHYANPLRALMLARSLEVLPERVFVLGCEAMDTDDFAMGMHKTVQASVGKAVDMLLEWIEMQAGKATSGDIIVAPDAESEPE